MHTISFCVYKKTYLSLLCKSFYILYKLFHHQRYYISKNLSVRFGRPISQADLDDDLSDSRDDLEDDLDESPRVSDDEGSEVEVEITARQQVLSVLAGNIYSQ